jgi:hypothetical protein
MRPIRWTCWAQSLGEPQGRSYWLTRNTEPTYGMAPSKKRTYGMESSTNSGSGESGLARPDRINRRADSLPRWRRRHHLRRRRGYWGSTVSRFDSALFPYGALLSSSRSFWKLGFCFCFCCGEGVWGSDAPGARLQVGTWCSGRSPRSTPSWCRTPRSRRASMCRFLFGLSPGWIV